MLHNGDSEKVKPSEVFRYAARPLVRQRENVASKDRVTIARGSGVAVPEDTRCVNDATN